MPIDCPDGPPCHSLKSETSAKSSTKSKTALPAATISQLCRMVFSYDFADIVIYDSADKKLTQYERSLLRSSIPAKFGYELSEACSLALLPLVGQTIRITTTIYDPVTGKKKSEDNLYYRLEP